MVKVEFQPLQMRMFVHLIAIIKKDTQLKIFSENWSPNTSLQDPWGREELFCDQQQK